MLKTVRLGLLFGLFALFLAGPAWAQQGSAPPPGKASAASTTAAVIPENVPTQPAFDMKAATDAYLAKIPPDKKARSDAYFEGRYWLILWNFLFTVAMLILILETRLSARMRDLAERVTRRKPLQTALYFIQFLTVLNILGFPLSVYAGYIREHKYGLSTESFGLWMREELIGLAISLVLGSLLAMMLFGIVRRIERTWWIWGAVATVAFSAFVMLIAPVYFSPLFNKYTKLQDPKIKDSILSMARANGIPVSEVYEVDASRQTTRVSANVSGFLGTERITLNDNLLKRCSPAEIKAVMGHEMGHYVLHHIYTALLFFGVVIVVAYSCMNWGLGWSLARWGQRWGIRGITDVAVMPLAVLILTIFGFVFTPVGNTFIRAQEQEADIFGLNAAQQPDGEAEIALKLGEYRKLEPGPVEEFVFYDHPSGRARITAAMRWKAEHLAKGLPALP